MHFWYYQRMQTILLKIIIVITVFEIYFSDEDKALIKNIHQVKKYGSRRILAEFSEKKLEKERTGHLT